MKVRIEVPIEKWLKEPKECQMRFIKNNDCDSGLAAFYQKGQWYDFWQETKISNPTHVLEEVELSELIKEMMPSEEEPSNRCKLCGIDWTS